MSLFVIILCFTNLHACTEENAAMVLRKEMTTAGCRDEYARVETEIKKGLYVHPLSGGYGLMCRPVEPTA